jgi:hypothetical protein
MDVMALMNTGWPLWLHLGGPVHGQFKPVDLRTETDLTEPGGYFLSFGWQRNTQQRVFKITIRDRRLIGPFTNTDAQGFFQAQGNIAARQAAQRSATAGGLRYGVQNFP